MEVGKIQYFERVEKSVHQEFINSENNCILCSSALELRHVRELDSNTIKEEAHCPQCELRTRAKSFTMN